MNKIITLKNLVELIAKRAGVAPAASDAFLKAFTGLIRECLVAREPVKINGIGEFSVDQASKKIRFIPDQELADTVNAPFAMFQPEELAPAVTIDELRAAPQPAPAAETEPQPEPEPVPILSPAHLPLAEDEPVPVPETTILPMLEPEPVPEPEARHTEPEPVPQPVSEPVPAPVAEPEPDPTPDPTPVPQPQPERCPTEPISRTPSPTIDIDDDEEYEDEEESKPGLPGFWIAISLIAGAIIGILIGFFLHDPIMKKLEPSLNDQVEQAAEPAMEQGSNEAENLPLVEAKEEIAEIVETAQSKIDEQKEAEPVYDTIETTLSALARKHYGHAEYWVYICKENGIKNPNHVQKGQRVKIPPIEKYATSATEAENLQNARNEGKALEDAANKKK